MKKLWNGNKNNFEEEVYGRKNPTRSLRNRLISLHLVRCFVVPPMYNLLTFYAVPAMTPIPQLAPAIARLTAALTALTTSHTQNAAAMHSLADEREQLEVREKEMREMIVKAEDKRSWFAAFREWVESVATFLDEKVGYDNFITI